MPLETLTSHMHLPRDHMDLLIKDVDTKDTAQVVKSTIKAGTNGLLENTPYLNALTTAASNGGDDVINALNYQNDINNFMQTIAPLADKPWQYTTNEDTGAPILFLAAELGDQISQFEITLTGISPQNADTAPTPMVTTTINIGGVNWQTITQDIAIGDAPFVVSEAIYGVWLKSVQAGAQTTLKNLEEGQTAQEKRIALKNSDEALEAELVPREEEINAAIGDLADATVALDAVPGVMIGLVAVAAIAEVFSLLVHDTYYTFTVVNNTSYKMRWSLPDMDHGHMNSAPSDGKGGWEHIIPGGQNIAPPGGKPVYSYSSAIFSFLEKEALYGVTGNIKFEFLDADSNVKYTSILAFNMPYHGHNGLGLAFGDTVPSHENPDKKLSWTAGSGELSAAAGVSALKGEHMLPGQKDKGYNYASTVTYQQSSDS